MIFVLNSMSATDLLDLLDHATRICNLAKSLHETLYFSESLNLNPTRLVNVLHVHLLQTCLIWHSSKSSKESKDWTSRDGLFRDSWQDTAATLRLSYSPRALQIWECGSPNNPWIKMLPRYWWEQRSAALSVSVSHCMMLLDAFGPSCHFIEWAINNMSFSNGEHHKNNLHKTLLFVAQMACWPSASRQPELN